MSMKIAILGGGNGAHAAACDLTLRGCEVRLCEDERFAANMQKVFDSKTINYKGALGTGTAEISMVTTNLNEAVDGAEVILVAVPAFAHKVYAKKLAQIVKKGQIVFVIPGTFGSLTFWKEFKAAGVTEVAVAETNTLPYATRLVCQGEVMIMSRFNPLKVGLMPAKKTAETLEVLSKLYDNLVPVESVIACGLGSLNPIIHVPGCILNAGRIEYTGEPFYYYTEGFTDCVARATEQLDLERCAILQKLGYQNDIVAHEIGGAIKTDSVKEAISNDPSFAKITVPASFKYRYYTEDIPYGLAIWAKLAHQLGVSTPIMDSMITLGSCITNSDCWSQGRDLDELGITGMDADVLKNYLIQG